MPTFFLFFRGHSAFGDTSRGNYNVSPSDISSLTLTSLRLDSPPSSNRRPCCQFRRPIYPLVNISCRRLDFIGNSRSPVTRMWTMRQSLTFNINNRLFLQLHTNYPRQMHSANISTFYLIVAKLEIVNSTELLEKNPFQISLYDRMIQLFL